MYMRVICIKKGGWKWAQPMPNNPKDPVFGETVTVLDTVIQDGLLLYLFIEYDSWYDSKYFAPLSDIDETTFERNYNVDWFDEIFIQPLKKS